MVQQGRKGIYTLIHPILPSTSPVPDAVWAWDKAVSPVDKLLAFRGPCSWMKTVFLESWRAHLSMSTSRRRWWLSSLRRNGRFVKEEFMRKANCKGQGQRQ